MQYQSRHGSIVQKEVDKVFQRSRSPIISRFDSLSRLRLLSRVILHFLCNPKILYTLRPQLQNGRQSGLFWGRRESRMRNSSGAISRNSIWNLQTLERHYGPVSVTVWLCLRDSRGGNVDHILLGKGIIEPSHFNHLPFFDWRYWMTLIFARHEAYMRARVKGKTLENISKKEISHLK